MKSNKKSKNLVHVRLELTAFALLARRSTNGPTEYKLWDVRPQLLVYEVQQIE